MATRTDDVYNALRIVDVTGHVEEKDTGKAKLKYLSWAWAWDEVRKRYPSASYSIVKNEHGLPYFVDPQLGIMVYTTVTIDGETHEMWLPVMDGSNSPMKLEPYSISTKWGSKPVAAATMFDINKTVMRCLTKNLAMFGIGLALYAGEDLFDDIEGNKGDAATKPETRQATKTVSKTQSQTTVKAQQEVTSQTAESNSENKLIELSEVIKLLDEKVKMMTATMDDKQKDALAARIKAKCGVVNYRKCTDVTALNALWNEIKVA